MILLRESNKMTDFQELDGQLDSILSGSLLVKFLLNNIAQTNNKVIVAWLPTIKEYKAIIAK